MHYSRDGYIGYLQRIFFGITNNAVLNILIQCLFMHVCRSSSKVYTELLLK